MLDSEAKIVELHPIGVIEQDASQLEPNSAAIKESSMEDS